MADSLIEQTDTIWWTASKEDAAWDTVKLMAKNKYASASQRYRM